MDDKVECLECGGWFRSVASHLYPAHGLRADEYRLRHDIAMNDPLAGAPMLDRRITPRQRQMLALAREHVSQAGTLMRATPNASDGATHPRARSRSGLGPPNSSAGSPRRETPQTAPLTVTDGP